MRLLVLGGSCSSAATSRKAACERAVTAAFPGSSCVVRAGLLVGPHDPTNRFGRWVREPWEDLPLWLALQRHPEMRGFMAVDVSRALAEGLAVRPLEETVRDITGG